MTTLFRNVKIKLGRPLKAFHSLPSSDWMLLSHYLAAIPGTCLYQHTKGASYWRRTLTESVNESITDYNDSKVLL